MTEPLYDISPPIRMGTPVWPGDTEYAEVRTASIGPGCPVNVSSVTMSTHTGSHADAPFHYDADGKTVGQVDLARYLGPCRVVHVIGVSPLIEPEHVAGHLEPGIERVLFRTYQHAPIETWDSDFTAIAPATIELLHENGVVLVGLDTPSLDPQELEDARQPHGGAPPRHVRARDAGARRGAGGRLRADRPAAQAGRPRRRAGARRAAAAAGLTGPPPDRDGRR